MNTDNIKLQELCEELHKLADLVAGSQDLRVRELPIVERLNVLISTYWPVEPKVWVERRTDGKPVSGSAKPSAGAAQSGGLLSKAQSLRNAVAFGKENGKRNLIVDLDLLDEIFRGNVPVGGNQYPPEDVNAKLYEMKAQRDKLLWKLSAICDLAEDELRRGSMVDGTNMHQIEADARAVLDEVRASILPKPEYPEKQDFIQAVRESMLPPAQKAEWERVVVWEAINEYVAACGGDTSDVTVSDRRMNAVAAVERALAPLGMTTALVSERGAIVSSADCSDMELAFARTEGRFFVDTNGYGFVLRPKLWRENAELALKHLPPVPETP